MKKKKKKEEKTHFDIWIAKLLYRSIWLVNQLETVAMSGLVEKQEAQPPRMQRGTHQHNFRER